MIGCLRGIIIEKQPPLVVVDVTALVMKFMRR